MIDETAPILPGKEIGNIKLYTHIKEFYQYFKIVDVEVSILWKYYIKYEIKDLVDLWFNVNNGKLFKITALKKYKGKLDGYIAIGMPIEDVMKIDDSFTYDEFEEVYYSPKGVYIETDPIENRVLWISVVIKEIGKNEFEGGNW